MLKTASIPSAATDVSAFAVANNLSEGTAATMRSNLGLGNVDNTADTAKPVSTAQQTALNLKADLASPALTGQPTIAGGTVTTDLQALLISQTWNNSGVNFTTFKVNVTNTASGSTSKLLDLQVGGTSKFSVDKSGNMVTSLIGRTTANGSAANAVSFAIGSTSTGFYDFAAGYVAVSSSGTCCGVMGANGYALNASGGGQFTWSNGSPASVSADTGLARNAAGVVEFNNGTAGTLRDWKARRAALTEYADISSMTAPAAPAASTARFYADTSGGKVRLMVIFPSGAAQQIAIEP